MMRGGVDRILCSAVESAATTLGARKNCFNEILGRLNEMHELTIRHDEGRMKRSSDSEVSQYACCALWGIR